MISFTIPGAPVGKGRPKVSTRGGKFARMYTPEKTVNYEGMVAFAAQQAMAGRAPITGPVALGLEVSMQVPASWSKKKRAAALAGEVLPMVKPDLSNILKAIEDGMNAVVYADDAQIVDYLPMKKRYAETPGVRVVVAEIQGALFAA